MSRLQIASSWLTRRFTRFRSRAELQAYQQKHAEEMVRHAYERSPFYRARLFAPTWEALQHMPPINKGVMMENFDALNTHGVRLDDAMHVALRAESERDFRGTLAGLTVGLSSGTSGSRGLFLVSDAERYRWAGAILERLLPGSLLGPRRDRIAFFLRANSNLYEAIGSRRVRFEYFDLLEPLEQQLSRLSALEPTLIVGPPSLLVALAEKQERGHIQLAPERVVSVAEVLDVSDEVRLRRAFRTSVVHQVYQATEGLLGTSCAYGTVHLAEDLVVFQREYLDASRTRFMPIVSDLFRTSQPILRYRLDDVLVERSEPCLCGSVLSGLERIEGRADDVFWIRGRSAPVALYPDFVRRAVITHAPRVRDYYVRQRSLTLIELFLDVEQDLEATRGRVMEALRDLCVAQGGNAPEFNLIPRPQRNPSKKLRRVERAFAFPDHTTEGATHADS